MGLYSDFMHCDVTTLMLYVHLLCESPHYKYCLIHQAIGDLLFYQIERNFGPRQIAYADRSRIFGSQPTRDYSIPVFESI